MAVVLITGSSVGIGRATALDLARAGHTVITTMRDLARGAELAATAAAERLPIHLRVLDVDRDASVASCLGGLLAEGVVPDVLVNNAGIERHGAIEELSMAAIREVMETNYFGAVRCTKALIGPMRERGSGCIVNVTSVAGRIASSPLGAYAASKHALEALGEALAQELRPFGVRVRIVEPGITDTAMAQAMPGSASPRYRQVRQMAALFRASLSHPVPPTVTAGVIRAAIESDGDQLRWPAGPDAAGFLAWRASMSDEAWVAFNSMPDDEWVAAVKATFGMDVALA